MAIVLVLLSSKWLVTIVGVSVLFICSVLLLWHLPWVEDYPGRRVLLMVFLAGACVVFGYLTWPTPEISRAPAPELTGLLIPANERSPAIVCGQTVAPRNALIVALGPLIVVTEKADTSLQVQGERLFTVTKGAGGIKISARVVSSSNRVVAAIADNVLYVNPSNRFQLQRPDWHSLIVIDTEDEHKKKVLDVYFLNPRFVRVYGDFYIPGGAPFSVSEEFSLIGANIMEGNATSACVVVTDEVDSSDVNFGGLTFVAQ